MRKLLKKMIYFIENEQGELLELYPLILVICVFLALLFNSIFPIFIYSQALENFAVRVKSDIEDYGGITPEVLENIEYYKENIIQPDSIDYSESEFIYGEEKIQMLDKVVIKVSRKLDIDFYIFKAEIEIPASAYGKSQVYWKD